MQTAKQQQLPVGRVLITSGYLNELQLKGAVQAQSLLKDGLIQMQPALKALRLLAREQLTLEDALARVGWKPKGGSVTNKLGEILIESQVISANDLQNALEQCTDLGLPLGRMLVLIKAMPESMLSNALNAQVLLRDRKISREQAVQGLKAAKHRQVPIEHALAESGVLNLPSPNSMRLGEMLIEADLIDHDKLMVAVELGLVKEKLIGQVLLDQGLLSEPDLEAAVYLQRMLSNGSIGRSEAIQALKTCHKEKTNVAGALAKKQSAELDLEPKTELSMEQFLKLSGIVASAEVEKAIRHCVQDSDFLGKMLLFAGVLPEPMVEACLDAYALLSDNTLSMDQAMVALRYCQTHKVDLETAFKRLGWAPDEDQESTQGMQHVQETTLVSSEALERREAAIAAPSAVPPHATADFDQSQVPDAQRAPDSRRARTWSAGSAASSAPAAPPQQPAWSGPPQGASAQERGRSENEILAKLFAPTSEESALEGEGAGSATSIIAPSTGTAETPADSNHVLPVYSHPKASEETTAEPAMTFNPVVQEASVVQKAAFEPNSQTGWGAPLAAVEEPAASGWGAPPAAEEPAASDWGAPTATEEPAASGWGAPTATEEPAASEWGAPPAMEQNTVSGWGAPPAAEDNAVSEWGEPPVVDQSPVNDWASPPNGEETPGVHWTAPPTKMPIEQSGANGASGQSMVPGNAVANAEVSTSSQAAAGPEHQATGVQALSPSVLPVPSTLTPAERDEGFSWAPPAPEQAPKKSSLNAAFSSMSAQARKQSALNNLAKLAEAANVSVPQGELPVLSPQLPDLDPDNPDSTQKLKPLPVTNLDSHVPTTTRSSGQAKNEQFLANGETSREPVFTNVSRQNQAAIPTPPLPANAGSPVLPTPQPFPVPQPVAARVSAPQTLPTHSDASSSTTEHPFQMPQPVAAPSQSPQPFPAPQPAAAPGAAPPPAPALNDPQRTTGPVVLPGSGAPQAVPGQSERVWGWGQATPSGPTGLTPGATNPGWLPPGAAPSETQTQTTEAPKPSDQTADAGAWEYGGTEQTQDSTAGRKGLNAFMPKRKEK
jgi:hypothetical protein